MKEEEAVPKMPKGGYHCDVCQRQYKGREKLRPHKLRQHKKSLVPCLLCKRKLLLRSLIQHL